jgi:hypothetical protein
MPGPILAMTRKKVSMEEIVCIAYISKLAEDVPVAAQVEGLNWSYSNTTVLLRSSGDPIRREKVMMLLRPIHYITACSKYQPFC